MARRRNKISAIGNEHIKKQEIRIQFLNAKVVRYSLQGTRSVDPKLGMDSCQIRELDAQIVDLTGKTKRKKNHT